MKHQYHIEWLGDVYFYDAETVLEAFEQMVRDVKSELGIDIEPGDLQVLNAQQPVFETSELVH